MTSATRARIAREIVCRAVTTAVDLAAHHRIRHAVFVGEQRVFASSDLDSRDTETATRHVLGLVNGTPAGAVRLYPLDEEGKLWLGDRLAVLPEFRVRGLGGPLVAFAVTTAAELGGDEMLAHIQVPNVRFFERLGWRADGETELYCGLPHVPMKIALH